MFIILSIFTIHQIFILSDFTSFSLHTQLQFFLTILGYFTDECSEDLATMREGIKLSRRLASSESFAKYKGEEVFPGNHIQTDDELDEYIRNVSVRGFIRLFFHGIFKFNCIALLSAYFFLIYCITT